MSFAAVARLSLILCLVAAGARTQVLTLTGPTGQSRTLGAAEIAAMPHQSANLAREDGGAPRTYRGVPFSDLLQSVGAPAGRGLRGPALALVVVAKGADGYRAVLALAETDALMRDSHVLLADSVDGAPLPPNEGPFRLVVEADKRPARSVRMVNAITVEAAP
jgi:DMSO/TMAO reductase YedYZ molybdopterin-dependent catalytic subunit